MINPIKIEAVNLTKRFGEQVAVDHINLEVNPGEILGFLGPNGAGIGEIWPQLVSLTGLTVIYFLIGYWIYRKRHMMVF